MYDAMVVAMYNAMVATVERQTWVVRQPPKAPQLAGARKVVYISRTRHRHLQLLPQVYCGSQVCMQVTKANVAEQSAQQGHAPQSYAGNMTKDIRTWRAMGRELTDTELLVLSMGWVGFRDAHLTSYAVIAQGHLTVAIDRV